MSDYKKKYLKYKLKYLQLKKTQQSGSGTRHRGGWFDASSYMPDAYVD